MYSWILTAQFLSHCEVKHLMLSSETMFVVYISGLGAADASHQVAGWHIRWAPCWPQESCYLGWVYLFQMTHDCQNCKTDEYDATYINILEQISCDDYCHLGLGWLYVFSLLPRGPPHPPRPPPQKLFPLTLKPFELNLWYLAQRIYGSGEMYWMTFLWLWPKVTAVA